MRVCVFIDGSNFYYACKAALGRTDVDLGRFAAFLVQDRRLVRTYYYNSLLPPDASAEARKSQRSFLTALERTAYLEVRLGRLVRRTTTCVKCGHRAHKYLEKGVDMRIGVDLLAGASRDLFDTAVLVTGDGDLVQAVSAAKDLGKHVEVAVLPSGRSDELLAAADVVHELEARHLQPLLLRA